MVETQDDQDAKKAPKGTRLMSKLKNKLLSRSSGESKRAIEKDSNLNKAKSNPLLSVDEQISFNNDHAEPSRDGVCQFESLSAPICKLWNQAYDDLRERERDLINDYEAALRENLSATVASTTNIGREVQMKIVLKAKVEEVEKTMWKLRFGSSEIPVQDLMAPLVSIIDWSNDYITAAMSSNPYGSIAWAGVSLLLPLLLNPSKQAASLAKGLEYISGLIVQSSIREDLYRRRYEAKQSGQSSKDFSPFHIGYRDALKELYARILKLQAASVCYYSKHTASRILRDSVQWDKWDSLLESIQTQEAAFQSVNKLLKDTKYEEDCIVSENRHQEGMKSLESIGVDLFGLRKAVEEAEANKQRRELLAWLSSIDPSENYNSARDIHESETSKWLVEDSKEFQDWKTLKNSFLWLHGKAGSGKSVLSSSVIEHLQDLYGSDPYTAVGFFYLSFSDFKKQDTVGMLGSLIKQLCCRRPNTPQPLIDLGRYKEQGHRPDMKTLETTLAATMHGFSRVYLVIDALDECPTGNGERTKLLGCLRRILAAKFSNLHLFCTSRKEADIETVLASLMSFPSNVAIDLSESKDAVSNDISLYIEQTLRTSDYDSWPEDIKARTRTALISKADGMFQYVSCQFDALRGLSSASEIQMALENLPENLDSTYDRMLEQINARYWKQTANVLTWLAFSLRPLYLHEIAEIFILDNELTTPLNENNRLFKCEEVLKYLSGLVTAHKSISQIWGSVWRGEVVEVQFTHFSVKEYLISRRMRHHLVSKFYINEDTAHLSISNTCLAYHLQISSLEVDSEIGTKRFALWEYAVWYWATHLERVDRKSWTESTMDRVLQALQIDGQSQYYLFRTDNLHFQDEDRMLTKDKVPSPLYYTACLRAFQLAKLTICNGTDINASGGIYGTAIQAAAFRGSTSIVQLLLDHGADINANGGYYGNALEAAASAGHASIIQLLLDHGADVNASGGYYGTALQAAAYAGRASIVQLLLDRGADINASGGRQRNALQAAAVSGDTTIVQLLLDHGADVNAHGEIYGNALQAATASQNTSIVQLLLDHGANINARGGPFETALQAAAYWRSEPIVQLLLNSGADVNAQGGKFGNALIAAVNGRNSIIKRLLLDYGADIDSRGGEYGNALQMLIVMGDIDTARLLLLRGAKLDPPGEKWEELLRSIEDGGFEEEADRLRQFQESPTRFLANAYFRGP